MRIYEVGPRLRISWYILLAFVDTDRSSNKITTRCLLFARTRWSASSWAGRRWRAAAPRKPSSATRGCPPETSTEEGEPVIAGRTEDDDRSSTRGPGPGAAPRRGQTGAGEPEKVRAGAADVAGGTGEAGRPNAGPDFEIIRTRKT